MDTVAPAWAPTQSVATDREKENLDQKVAFGKFAKKLAFTGDTGAVVTCSSLLRGDAICRCESWFEVACGSVTAWSSVYVEVEDGT